jgi:hypothetical protein
VRPLPQPTSRHPTTHPPHQPLHITPPTRSSRALRRNAQAPAGAADAASRREFFSRRLTGRPEGQPRPAPWGYGDAFDAAAAPPRLRALVAMLRAAPGYRLGAPRDITVNFRRNGVFQVP